MTYLFLYDLFRSIYLAILEKVTRIFSPVFAMLYEICLLIMKHITILAIP